MLVVMLLLPAAKAQAGSCDADTEARLSFLETRLDDGRAGTARWWNAWLAVFAFGALFKTTEGALEGDGSNAAADYIAAGKSVLGVADLTLRAHAGRHGAERVRTLPKDTPDHCAARLRAAESALSSAGLDAGARWSWKQHLSSLILNLGAGLALAEGWNDPGTGWRDFAVSEASSELHLWTHPTRAVGDWSEYRQRFDGIPRAADTPTFRLAAVRGGLGIDYRF